MGALSIYIEEEGIATTQISLVREHSAAIRPPRALWVPFPLGRPFGAPNEVSFQRKVLLRALRLLENPVGPILEDFQDDAPGSQPQDQAEWVCPVNFNGPLLMEDPDGLQKEIAELIPWHDLATKLNGRSTVGLSGLDLADAAQFITAYIQKPGLPSYRDDLSAGLALRLACEDIKSYYFEALLAQPGDPTTRQLQEFFWKATVAGKVFRKLREVCISSEDKSVRVFGQTNLTPRTVSNEKN